MTDNRGKELNKTANETIGRLDNFKYFEDVKKIEQEIHSNLNVFNKVFYLKHQSKLNWINGEMRIAYGELKALLDTYVAVRKVEMLQNKKCIVVNGKMISLSREPGNDLLTEFVYSEVPELLRANILLASWLTRMEGVLILCRSHVYGNGGK